MFTVARGTDQTAIASATATASFSNPLSQRLSVRPPQSRAQARTLKHRRALRELVGSWSAQGGAYALRSRDVTAVVSLRLQRVRSCVRMQSAWRIVRGLYVVPPNHAFDRSAGQRGWPVPSSLRSSAPPERERWASSI